MKKIYAKSGSQSLQESFVLNVLSELKDGYYLEIGGHDPYGLNNTSLLEEQFGWNGVAIEIEKKWVRRYNRKRKNPCICADATSFDYLKYLSENNFPKVIDYLQVDIEPAYQTLSALMRVPLDKYRFRVITFEHDLHAESDNQRVAEISRNVLNFYGYELVCKEVKNSGNPYEDWYVDPKLVPLGNYQDFYSEGLEYTAIFDNHEVVT